MIDPSIQIILNRAIDSPLKLQLLLIFYEDQFLVSTPTKLSERICHDIWSVKQALQELTEDGILRGISTLGDRGYRYDPRSEYIGPIAKLIEEYDDPLKRDYLQHCIRELAGYASFRRSSAWERQIASA